jgi:hypothetical protein
MAYTQQQLTDLQAAIAEGVLVVVSNGRRIEYRSLSEMLQVERMMIRELGGTNTRPDTRRYAAFRRD